MKKTSILLFILLSLNSCCDDDYRFAVVWFNILKDDKPLSEANIYPYFVYVDENNNENSLTSNGLMTSGSSYSINQSSELELMSFKPATILIKYTGLDVSQTDTLEILLDYECNKTQRCACKTVVLKYMKCNSEFLDDFTIRK